MIIITLTDAKARLSALIENVQGGEEVIIKKGGKPVAKISSFNDRPLKRRAGALKGKIKISPDFDELPPDLAKAFGMAD
jgi:prevent-host-death family protein